MDLDALKSKLEEVQQKNQPKTEKIDYSTIYWKPPVGKSQIRIVPSAYNSKIPFTELKFYYGITHKIMSSPLNYGEKDPIAIFASKLREEYNKENYVLAKKLDAKTRIFVPVLVRGEEESGIRLWQFGQQVYEGLLALAVDDEIGDYTDVVNGRDLTVETVGPDSTGTPYNKSSVRVRLTQTPLSENSSEVETWLKEQPNPIEQFRKYSFEEVKSALEKWLSPEDENEDGEDIIDEKNDDFDDASEGLPWEKDEKKSSNFSLDTSKVKETKGDKFDKLFEE